MPKDTTLSPQWELAIVEHLRAVNFQPTFNKAPVKTSLGEKLLYLALPLSVVAIWLLL